MKTAIKWFLISFVLNGLLYTLIDMSFNMPIKWTFNIILALFVSILWGLVGYGRSKS